MHVLTATDVESDWGDLYEMRMDLRAAVYGCIGVGMSGGEDAEDAFESLRVLGIACASRLGHSEVMATMSNARAFTDEYMDALLQSIADGSFDVGMPTGNPGDRY